ncbi:nucleotidyltransferase [Saccharibacillus endophyticus]|uniref:Nucleotidyltransferase n=1 Tax=Saccharibacillus endophyticus TaxID=2060666 RepID=A0ABQ1ZLF7_9BACL|nr:nucleotidyltransferase [Saccharibacillus endophyticus]GGH68193.1 nucleotidyltransferase [Saccharibacillus endophyticus]
MILEKVIPELNIQREYKDFVDAYIDQIRAEFEDKIHSVYMCGSIPKGTAVPFKSDADFTIVCENAGDIDYGKLETIKNQLVEKYPFLTKIDTIVCPVDDVVSRPNEWGFWIKVICICVYGEDIGEQVPPIVISPAFILELNTDTPEEIERIRHSLSNADDRSLKTRYVKGYSKRLLRALYSLILEDTGVWQDDMLEMKNDLLKYCEINPAIIEYLYACYLDSHVSVEEFLEIADEAYCYVEQALQAMEISRET